MECVFMSRERFTLEYFNEICNVMSKDRLMRYAPFMTNGLAHLGVVIVPYVAIQHASSMLLPTFQLVEICLRNRIDNAIRKYYTLHDNGNDPYTWYDWLIPSTKTHSVIKDAKNRAMRDTKKTHLSHGDIISHISFGAWISITKELQKMEREVWREICNDIFHRDTVSKLPSSRAMLSKLAEMNEKRNRLFHHEPIWSGKNTQTLGDAENNIKHIHKEALECIRWLSPCLYDYYTNGGIKYDKTFDSTVSALFAACKQMSQIPPSAGKNKLTISHNN